MRTKRWCSLIVIALKTKCVALVCLSFLITTHAAAAGRASADDLSGVYNIQSSWHSDSAYLSRAGKEQGGVFKPYRDVYFDRLRIDWISQQWRLESAGNNLYRVQNLWGEQTGYLTRTSIQRSDGPWFPSNRVFVRSLIPGSTSQLWRFEPTGDGRYRISNAWDESDGYLSQDSSRFNPKNQLELNRKDGRASQLWTLTRRDDGGQPDNRPRIIYDTDMGPDIDDVLALAMLHGYEKQNMAKIIAVTVSRNSDRGARLTDLLNTFYGRPNIPVGVFRGSTPKDVTGDAAFTNAVVFSGHYPHDVHQQSIPQGYQVMRQALANSPDGSVSIVQTGFSTNTADLLNSGPDAYSSLNGEELIRKKVKRLYFMGGENSREHAEFNIIQHLQSAQTVLARWPVEIMQSEGSLGSGILYPLNSIYNDYNYVTHHPVKQAYLTSDLSWHQDNGDYYDMRSWDLTSVMAATEDPSSYFKLSQPGTISVNDQGYTRFTPSASGKHRTMGYHWQLSEAERQKIVNRMIELSRMRP